MTWQNIVTPLSFALVSAIVISLSAIILTEYSDGSEFILALTVLVLSLVGFGICLTIAVFAYNAPTESTEPSVPTRTNCCWYFFAFLLSIITVALSGIILNIELTQNSGQSTLVYSAIMLAGSCLVLIISSTMLMKWGIRKYNS
jgi:hypothetical protein